MIKLAIKYLCDDSTGHSFTTGETRTVVVTNEELDVATGFEGDTFTYTATVLDSTTAKLPATFVADLLISAIKLKDAQAFGAGVYSQSTGLLTLVCTVPAGASGEQTVKLSWADQII